LTTVVGLCTEFIVNSISVIMSGHSNILVEFVGLILLLIVGNAVKHVTAVTVTCKDKMDLAISVAIGSSMQIALLVIPFSVILGWILGYNKMNLSFDRFQTALLFVSVLLVNYLISDGKRYVTSNQFDFALWQKKKTFLMVKVIGSRVSYFSVCIL
jgi:Ca2+:H+ antiporter